MSHTFICQSRLQHTQVCLSRLSIPQSFESFLSEPLPLSMEVMAQMKMTQMFEAYSSRLRHTCACHKQLWHISMTHVHLPLGIGGIE